MVNFSCEGVWVLCGVCKRRNRSTYILVCWNFLLLRSKLHSLKLVYETWRTTRERMRAVTRSFTIHKSRWANNNNNETLTNRHINVTTRTQYFYWTKCLVQKKNSKLILTHFYWNSGQLIVIKKITNLQYKDIYFLPFFKLKYIEWLQNTFSCSPTWVPVYF